jgi:hypothetical protein
VLCLLTSVTRQLIIYLDRVETSILIHNHEISVTLLEDHDDGLRLHGRFVGGGRDIIEEGFEFGFGFDLAIMFGG